MSGIIRAPRPDRGWTEIPNTTIRDKRLSYQARGVLVRLLSNADGFRMTAIDLAGESPQGRHSVLTALRELKEAGYIVRKRSQNGKGHWGTETYVFDNPQVAEIKKLTEVRIPDFGSPDLGSPYAGSPDRNKNYKEKNQQKKQKEPPPQWIEAVEVEIENQRKLKGVTNEDGLRESILKRYADGNKGPGPGVLKQLEARKRAQEQQVHSTVATIPKASPEAAARRLAAAKRALTMGAP